MAARDYFYNNAPKYDTPPMDAVVRRIGNEWAIESGIFPEADADIECDLDSFDAWFYESYSDPDFVPDDNDVKEFVYSLTADRITDDDQ